MEVETAFFMSVCSGNMLLVPCQNSNRYRISLYWDVGLQRIGM